MKKLFALILFGALALSASPLWAQTATTQTTFSTAVAATAQTVSVASATGITAGQQIYSDRELMLVTAITGTTVTVQRGYGGTLAQAHAVGALVFTSVANTATPFIYGTPQGGCTLTAPAANGVAVSTPAINVLTGELWDCVRDASSTAATSDGFNSTGTASTAASWRGSNELAPPQGPAYVNRTPVINTGYTIKVSDYLVAVTSLTTTGQSAANASGINLTLPSATGLNGKVIIIKDENGFIGSQTAGTHPVLTVIGTIDGATNQVIVAAYSVLKLYSDGRAWHRW